MVYEVNESDWLSLKSLNWDNYQPDTRTYVVLQPYLLFDDSLSEQNARKCFCTRSYLVDRVFGRTLLAVALFNLAEIVRINFIALEDLRRIDQHCACRS